jgi:hypothetical protein
MEQALTTLVWQRARATCEYCRLPQSLSPIPFEIDHIIAQKHGGATTPANLALTNYYSRVPYSSVLLAAPCWIASAAQWRPPQNRAPVASPPYRITR